ncbi:MAG: DUF6057 family protein [Tannerellaceae bacterium]|jgi:hypothetical protein|nr:DUF6057 family protein [Tannerellaceae bacterium]
MKRFFTSANLLSILFFLCSFLFLELNYRYFYRFMEQYSMFLYTGEYLATLCRQVGGLLEYVTAFVTQSFLLPLASSLCLAILLTMVGRLMLYLMRQTSAQASPLAELACFLPPFLFLIFPVESAAPVIASLAGTAAAALYASLERPGIRLAAGLALVTLLYPTAAPSHILAALLMLAHECGRRTGGRYTAAALLIAVWAAVLPLIAMRTIYIMPIREAFIGKSLFHPEYSLPASFWYIALSFPLTASLTALAARRSKPPRTAKAAIAALTLMAAASPAAIIYGGHPLEQAYLYDWLARQERWEAITSHASTHPVKDKDALVYLNMAHVHKGTFNQSLMLLPKIGEEGMIPHDPKTRLGLIEASEVSWLLNHTNAAQRFAFVGVLSSERNVQPRLMRRLIETYLVNEEYRAAAKYIGLLEKTSFHKRGMAELRKLLDPQTAGQTDWIARRRLLNPITDNPYDPTKALASTLGALIDDCPGNKAAFTYGMGYLLIYKDLGAFMHYMEKLKGEKLPVVYQEAICFYYAAVENNPEALSSYGIDPAVYSRFRGYLQHVGSAMPPLLARQYGDTYYYYAQFINPPIKSAQ